MAWTNITNAQLAIGAPIRSIDLLALRDNILAQANGDSGAPKQQTAGIADSAVTAQKVKYGAGLTASGDTLIASPAAFNGVGSYVYAQMNVGASVTIYAGNNYSAGSGFSQIYASSNTTDGTYSGTTSLSGTWKWMAATITNPTVEGKIIQGLAVRIA